VVTANSKAVADDTERRDGYPAARIVVIQMVLTLAATEPFKLVARRCAARSGSALTKLGRCSSRT
jgi:hypothetical protein